MVQKLKKYQFLFEELVKRDFKKKYKGTMLGMAWSLLSPLLTLLVMRIVFTQFFGAMMEHYTTYLFCGNWFLLALVKRRDWAWPRCWKMRIFSRKLMYPNICFCSLKIFKSNQSWINVNYLLSVLHFRRYYIYLEVYLAVISCSMLDSVQYRRRFDTVSIIRVF